MNESTLQWIQVCKLVLLAVYSTFYALGGMSGKWRRRFVAPILLVAGIVGLSLWAQAFSYWYIGYLPLLIASLHLGYGGDTFSEKMRKRFIYGLALGCAAAPVAIGSALIHGSKIWGLFGLHVGLCVIICISFGVFNITTSARTEETFMALLTAALPLAMV